MAGSAGSNPTSFAAQARGAAALRVSSLLWPRAPGDDMIINHDHGNGGMPVNGIPTVASPIVVQPSSRMILVMADNDLDPSGMKMHPRDGSIPREFTFKFIRTLLVAAANLMHDMHTYGGTDGFDPRIPPLCVWIEYVPPNEPTHGGEVRVHIHCYRPNTLLSTSVAMFVRTVDTAQRLRTGEYDTKKASQRVASELKKRRVTSAPRGAGRGRGRGGGGGGGGNPLADVLGNAAQRLSEVAKEMEGGDYVRDPTDVAGPGCVGSMNAYIRGVENYNKIGPKYGYPNPRYSEVALRGDSIDWVTNPLNPELVAGALNGQLRSVLLMHPDHPQNLMRPCYFGPVSAAYQPFYFPAPERVFAVPHGRIADLLDYPHPRQQERVISWLHMRYPAMLERTMKRWEGVEDDDQPDGVVDMRRLASIAYATGVNPNAAAAPPLPPPAAMDIQLDEMDRMFEEAGVLGEMGGGGAGGAAALPPPVADHYEAYLAAMRQTARHANLSELVAIGGMHGPAGGGEDMAAAIAGVYMRDLVQGNGHIHIDRTFSQTTAPPLSIMDLSSLSDGLNTGSFLNQIASSACEVYLNPVDIALAIFEQKVDDASRLMAAHSIVGDNAAAAAALVRGDGGVKLDEGLVARAHARIFDTPEGDALLREHARYVSAELFHSDAHNASHVRAHLMHAEANNTANTPVEMRGVPLDPLLGPGGNFIALFILGTDRVYRLVNTHGLAAMCYLYTLTTALDGIYSQPYIIVYGDLRTSKSFTLNKVRGLLPPGVTDYRSRDSSHASDVDAYVRGLSEFVDDGTPPFVLERDGKLPEHANAFKELQTNGLRLVRRPERDEVTKKWEMRTSVNSTRQGTFMATNWVPKFDPLSVDMAAMSRTILVRAKASTGKHGSRTLHDAAIWGDKASEDAEKRLKKHSFFTQLSNLAMRMAMNTGIFQQRLSADGASVFFNHVRSSVGVADGTRQDRLYEHWRLLAECARTAALVQQEWNTPGGRFYGQRFDFEQLADLRRESFIDLESSVIACGLLREQFDDPLENSVHTALADIFSDARSQRRVVLMARQNSAGMQPMGAQATPGIPEISAPLRTVGTCKAIKKNERSAAVTSSNAESDLLTLRVGYMTAPRECTMVNFPLLAQMRACADEDYARVNHTESLSVTPAVVEPRAGDGAAAEPPSPAPSTHRAMWHTGPLREQRVLREHQFIIRSHVCEDTRKDIFNGGAAPLPKKQTGPAAPPHIETAGDIQAFLASRNAPPEAGFTDGQTAAITRDIDVAYPVHAVNASSVVFAGPWNELLIKIRKAVSDRMGSQPSADHVWTALRALAEQGGPNDKYVLPYSDARFVPIVQPGSVPTDEQDGTTPVISIHGWARADKPVGAARITITASTGALLERESEHRSAAARRRSSSSVNKLTRAIDSWWHPGSIPGVRYILPMPLSVRNQNLCMTIDSKKGARTHIYPNTMYMGPETHSLVDAAYTGTSENGQRGDPQIGIQILDLDTYSLVRHLKATGYSDTAMKVERLASVGQLHPLHPIMRRVAARRALVAERQARPNLTVPADGSYPEKIQRETDRMRTAMNAVVSAVKDNTTVSEDQISILVDSVRRDISTESLDGRQTQETVNPCDSIVRALFKKEQEEAAEAGAAAMPPPAIPMDNDLRDFLRASSS